MPATCSAGTTVSSTSPWGQRRGLGLSGGSPKFVIRLEPDTRRVVVGSEQGLYRDTLYAAPVSWVSGRAPAPDTAVAVKIRYKFAGSAGHRNRRWRLRNGAIR